MNPFHEAHAYSKFQAIDFPATLPINQSLYQPTNIPAGDELYGGAATAQKFFGENKLAQIQLEMDALILEHTKKIRLELQERQKAAVARMGESVAKRLREKDDDMEKMVRSNVMLEEKANGLYAENQLWREVAQTNEAAANSLRAQLHHALAQLGVAEESCASCDYSIYEKRLCRMCGQRQCSVVVLPCRHLCLCGGCGSGSQACPVCNATMTATLHVNMS